MIESDAYKRYLRDISTYPRIAPEREVELAQLIQTSRNEEQIEAALNELIQANLRLVLHCQKEFEKYNTAARITPLDLIAEGNIGLMKAAQNYNPGFGCRAAEVPVRFSTYACKCIKSHMIRAIKKARFIHIPEHHFSYWTEIESLQREHGNLLTDADLRERMDISEEALALIKLSTRSGVCMLEDLASEESGSSWNEFIASENTLCPDEEAEQNDLRAFLLQEMDSLAPRTRQIISMLFFNEASPTLKDISAIFNISSERCRQICVQGLNRLKQQMLTRRHGISPHLAGNTCAA